MNTGSDRATGSSSTTDLLSNQKGVIMLEFVFTVSVLMVIFLAMVTFSFLFADYYGTQKVATDGAKEASITKDISWAREKALDDAWLWGLDTSRLSINFNQDSTAVTCDVAYTARPFSKTFPTLLEGIALHDVNIRAGATYVWLDTR